MEQLTPNAAITVITVPWPDYPIEIWRKWLEENISEQEMLWDWKVNLASVDAIDITFFRAQHATMFCLRWGGNENAL